ncbi:MAG TPA: protease pro-enzyme activation domain-containing protein [Candidatus Solibacter sp.]|nr:protease pro-enzyme activation domain-containing protein [Candidatus Solibacter sp.]
MRELASPAESTRACVAAVLVAAGALLVAPLPVAAAAPAGALVRLHGSFVAGLQPGDRIADVDPGQTMQIQIGLQLRDRGALDQLITSVSTPGSAEYGRYLTPADFDSRFGPTATQVSQAAGFLAARGLRVTAASAGSTLVDATGPAAAVEAAFDTTIGRYRDRTGREFFANDSDPAIPASLAPFVSGVQGLNNRYRRHHSAVAPRTCPSTCAPTPYTPSQLRQAYHLSAAPLTNLTGTGSLGLLELDDFLLANITSFDNSYGLPAITPTRLPVDGGTGRGMGQVEVELDIEVMHEIAPGASIQVFEAPNNLDSQLLDAYSCMVNPGGNTSCPNHASGAISPSNSTSWGLCERDQMASTTTALSNIFSRAAAQGQSFFAASGDTGAFDCRNFDGSVNTAAGLSVDSPASDPHITGAGGTHLLLNTDNSYNSETAWPNSIAHPNWGSGGGMSALFGRPPWQTGPGVNTSAGAARQVPDISLDADPATGYSIYTCFGNPPCTSGGSGLVSVGGTSAAAPAWAAFTAIYNQYAAPAKPNLGFANPTLYQLKACAQTFSPLNDITTGNNFAGQSAGYFASAGYDMVTGLGTLRAAEISQDLVAGQPLTLGSVAPSRGVAGDTVNLYGCGFQVSGNQVPSVTFGGTPSPSVNFVNGNNLTVVVPSHAPGLLTITVTNPAGAGGQSASLPSGFNYHSDDTLWSGWNTLASSVANPAVGTNADGRLEVTGLSPDHTAWHSWQNVPGGNFAGSASLGGSLAAGPSIGRNADGRLELFAKGTDGSTYHNWQNTPGGGWSGWYGLGGGIVGTPTVTSDADGRLELLVLANDHSVYHAWQQTPGSGWTGWYPLGGSLATTPTAGRNADGRLEIFAKGTDGGAWHAWQMAANGGWSGWSSLGGQISGSPTVGTNADGRLEMFVTASDSQTYHNWQTTAGSGWFGWALFSGSLTAAPAVASTPSGRLFVFGTNLNGQVYRQVQDAVNGSWTGWFSMGGPGLVQVVAGTNADGRIELFAQDSGGSFWHNWEPSPPT